MFPEIGLEDDLLVKGQKIKKPWKLFDFQALIALTEDCVYSVLRMIGHPNNLSELNLARLPTIKSDTQVGANVVLFAVRAAQSVFWDPTVVEG